MRCTIVSPIAPLLPLCPCQPSLPPLSFPLQQKARYGAGPRPDSVALVRHNDRPAAGDYHHLPPAVAANADGPFACLSLGPRRCSGSLPPRHQCLSTPRTCRRTHPIASAMPLRCCSASPRTARRARSSSTVRLRDHDQSTPVVPDRPMRPHVLPPADAVPTPLPRQHKFRCISTRFSTRVTRRGPTSTSD